MADWEALAAAELARLPEPHAAKKRATIIAIVDAELAGNSVDGIWIDPRLCNRSTWWNKWSKDPVIADVLGNVRKLAREWHAGRSVNALALAAERLALASPAAVTRVIRLLESQDPQVVLRAAFGILDRAGKETAAKAKSTLEIEYVNDWRDEN